MFLQVCMYLLYLVFIYFIYILLTWVPRYLHFIKLVSIFSGKQILEKEVPLLKKKHPNIEKVEHQRLQCSLQILQKFGITPLEACHNLHVFSMNPITVDNYGEILKECGFVSIMPKHIIK